jgi:hypothetical protein
MGIVSLAGCIAEEKTQGANAGTPGTRSIPVNGDSPAKAVNRTPGDNHPVTQPVNINMTEQQWPEPPAMGDMGRGGAGLVPPGGANGTFPAAGESPGGMKPPATPLS